MLLLVLCLVLTLVILGSRVLRTEPPKAKVTNNVSTCFLIVTVFGSGGHTSEMLQILREVLDRLLAMKKAFTVACTVIMAEGDGHSKTQFENLKSAYSEAIGLKLERMVVPRPRRVGQSYAYSVISTLKSIVHTWSKLSILGSANLRSPQLVLCNGPSTCIPVFAGYRMLSCVATIVRVLTFDKVSVRSATSMVYVESVCRARTLSLSGKLVYYLNLADKLIVRWPELVSKYPRCINGGNFI